MNHVTHLQKLIKAIKDRDDVIRMLLEVIDDGVNYSVDCKIKEGERIEEINKSISKVLKKIEGMEL